MDGNLIYNKEITMKTMLLFTVPTMVRMIFISMYSIVDGIVVSNFVGSLGLSAINIVYPVLNICMALAFMLAAGSNAIIGKKLGEGKNDEANSFMTLTVIINVVTIIVLAGLFLIWDEQIYILLGADQELLPYCVEYGTIMVMAGPIWVMQVLFQSYLVTADKPSMGLWLSVGAGITNIVLDLLFVGVLDMSMTGAALASVAGMFIGGLIPLKVFFNKKSLIHFGKPVWRGKEFLKAMGNGSSEMVSNLASAITTTLFNLQMMAFVGEKGVAAISAILYLQFIFTAMFFGFTSGIAPVVSYNYGAKNYDRVKSALKSAILFATIIASIGFILTQTIPTKLIGLFGKNEKELIEVGSKAMRVYLSMLPIIGFQIVSSNYFQATGKPKQAMLLSLSRQVIVLIPALIILPRLFKLNGVWMAGPVSDLIASIITARFLIKDLKQLDNENAPLSPRIDEQ